MASLEEQNKLNELMSDGWSYGGGGSVSWDDVQDRPFGKTVTIGDIVAEQPLQPGYGYFFINDPAIFSINLEKTYVVVYNGVEYTCVSFLSPNGYIGLGNGAPLGLQDTGEPFTIGIPTNPQYPASLMPIDKATSVVLAIRGEKEVITTIPPEYLPEGDLTSLVDGSTYGSVRTVGSSAENDDYVMGQFAFAEGVNTLAAGYCAHAEGMSTNAASDGAHAEGSNSSATGRTSHAEGARSNATGESSHAEGNYTTASGAYSHAEGSYTKADGTYQHVQGKYNIADTANKYAHIVGNGDSDSARSNAHTLDWDGNAWFAGDVYVGGTSQAEGVKLLKEGDAGASNLVNGSATGSVRGISTYPEGDGYTMGAGAFAEGRGTYAKGGGSHAEGSATTASGENSHAEGLSSTASGAMSHAEGEYTTAGSTSQHVQGKYNIVDTANKYAHIVGNGSASARSNAHTLDWDGNGWFAGTVECTAMILKSPNGTRYKVTVADDGTLSATAAT